MTVRARRAAQVATLRAQGLTHREVAAELGISRSYAAALDTDPDRVKEVARKDSYRGTCEVCGAKTDGSNGRDLAPKRCILCTPERTWNKDSLCEAIQEWARRRGRPPTATEWVAKTTDPDGYVFPSRTLVFGVAGAFEYWADAIEAAGFPRPIVGYYDRKERGMGHSREYVVFKTRDDGTLELAGEVVASSSQSAAEAVAEGPGEYATIPKGSLQRLTLGMRLVATKSG